MERRRVSEIKTQLLIEPEAGFVFAEGPTDRIIITQFIRKIQCRDHISIDCTQIDLTELEIVEGGNREKSYRPCFRAFERYQMWLHRYNRSRY